MPRTTTQQLVVARDRSIRAVDNTSRRDPTDFDKPDIGNTVPRLGSLSLLRLAAGARAYGYIVIEVGLRDRSMSELPIAAEEQLSEPLVEALRAGDLSEAQDLLQGERGPLTVVSVHLVGENDEDVRIGRMGTLESSSEDSLNQLIVPAWSALHLT